MEADYGVCLELCSTDDLVGFKRAVEEDCRRLDESSLWYGRRIGSKKMGFEERTPLMVAAMFGSEDVVSYILQTGRVDPNRACGSDGATALHCAAASGSCRSLEIVKLLVAVSADINCVDAGGNRPADLIAHCSNSSSKSRQRTLETVLKAEKKEYPVDPTLPDIKTGVYITDEFRMYTFKVRPCSRAYSHDWTECPFVHPGENARRRDPRTHHYSCVPCPEFRKGACGKGDGCEYSHGIFECWLHPAQYRTRLCKDESNCTRRVCFFAHKTEDLRPVYASTGSAVSQFDMAPLSPISLGSPNSSASSSPMWQSQLNSVTPPALQLQGSRLKTALNARDVGLEIRRQQLLEELAALSSNSPYGNASDLGMLSGGFSKNDVLGLPQSQSQLRSSYSSGFSSPVLRPSTDPCGSPSRFIDRGASSPTMTPSNLSPWGSPSGKLDWGIQGEELNKLRKCTSFGIRSRAAAFESPVSAIDNAHPGVAEERKQSCLNHGGSEMTQFYLEQQQVVA